MSSFFGLVVKKWTSPDFKSEPYSIPHSVQITKIILIPKKPISANRDKISELSPKIFTMSTSCSGNHGRDAVAVCRFVSPAFESDVDLKICRGESVKFGLVLDEDEVREAGDKGGQFYEVHLTGYYINVVSKLSQAIDINVPVCNLM